MPTLHTPLSDRFDAALLLAHRVHRSQARKGSQIPYIAHLLGVAALVLEFGGDETEAIAALLHDALEDAPLELGVEYLRNEIRSRFGHVVLEIIEHCTDTTAQPKPPWLDRKARYIEALRDVPAFALRVSAADKLHNIKSLLRDYRQHGEALWDRFNKEAGKRGTLGYYRALVDIFKQRMPGALADDLERALQALEDVVGEVGVWPPAIA